MKHEVIIQDTSDLDRAAAEFLEKIGDSTLVAFLHYIHRQSKESYQTG